MVRQSDPKTANPIIGTSSDPRARTTGVVYLLYFVTAVFAKFLHDRGLVSYGNAVNVVAIGCYIAVTLLFYEMFRPVNRAVSLSAALFSLAGCAIMTLSLVHLGPPNISPLLFFGPYCILIGYLIFQSAFLPWILGVLMASAGLGWLIFCVAAARRPSVFLHSDARHLSRGVVDAMAPRARRERPEVA